MSARSFLPGLPRWAWALLVVGVVGVSLVVADLVRHWQEERAAGFHVGGCVRFTEGAYTASLTPADCDDDQAPDVAWEVIEKHRINRWDLPRTLDCPVGLKLAAEFEQDTAGKRSRWLCLAPRFQPDTCYSQVMVGDEHTYRREQCSGAEFWVTSVHDDGASACPEGEELRTHRNWPRSHCEVILR